jgi:hypothetical protein
MLSCPMRRSPNLILWAISVSPKSLLLYGLIALLFLRSVASAAPQIIRQPLSQSLLAGDVVELLVAATSPTNLPMTYQWTKNGLVVTNATNSVLWITNATVADSGTFRVGVGNATGMTQSQAARVWIGSRVHSATPLALSGWNADVVSENSPQPYAQSFDNAGACWFEEGLQAHGDGLPHSREFTSELSTNVLYRLQPYNQSNVLFLQASQTAILTLLQPALVERLYLAVSGGLGTSSVTLSLEFADGSQSPALNVLVPDWFNGQNGFTGNLDTRPFRTVEGLARNDTAGWFSLEEPQLRA